MKEQLYPYIDSNKLIEILGLTIKHDEINKLITFIAMFSAYTEDSQINISFNAPSSSGKSFIPLEIVQLFPKSDVIKLGSASATAFYHERGTYNKETNTITVDLSRKIIIFLDQPNIQLLSRLRALLSHDEKEIQAKITDKNQKGGNRTKTVIIIGYPVVIFCTAGLTIDEQEATRFFLLSPDIDQDKIREAIYEKIRKSASPSIYTGLIEANESRAELIKRIEAIKELNISNIQIGAPAAKIIQQRFFANVKILKPRHQRDIARILNIVKVFALLNYWYKKQIDDEIYADEKDVEEAFNLWEILSESQELGLPPYILNIYYEVIIPAFEEKNSDNISGKHIGVTKNEIAKKHFNLYERFVPDWQLRQQILPMLETAGLISQEADQADKRKILIYPTTILSKPTNEENNSEPNGGEEPDNKNES